MHWLIQISTCLDESWTVKGKALFVGNSLTLTFHLNDKCSIWRKGYSSSKWKVKVKKFQTDKN